MKMTQRNLSEAGSGMETEEITKPYLFFPIGIPALRFLNQSLVNAQGAQSKYGNVEYGQSRYFEK